MTLNDNLFEWQIDKNLNQSQPMTLRIRDDDSGVYSDPAGGNADGNLIAEFTYYPDGNNIMPSADTLLQSASTLEFGGNNWYASYVLGGTPGASNSESSGCTDSTACNYDSNAIIDDGSCEYPADYYDCNGNCLNDTDGDGICDELEVSGCTNPEGAVNVGKLVDIVDKVIFAGNVGNVISLGKLLDLSCICLCNDIAAA